MNTVLNFKLHAEEGNRKSNAKSSQRKKQKQGLISKLIRILLRSSILVTRFSLSLGLVCGYLLDCCLLT
jgi:hypothetical protein